MVAGTVTGHIGSPTTRRPTVEITKGTGERASHHPAADIANHAENALEPNSGTVLPMIRAGDISAGNPMDQLGSAEAERGFGLLSGDHVAAILKAADSGIVHRTFDRYLAARGHAPAWGIARRLRVLAPELGA